MNVKSKKLKINLIFLSLSIAIILFLTWNTKAYPGFTDNPLSSGCHTTEASDSDIDITSNLIIFNYSKGESFEVEIQVIGVPSGYYVLFHPDQANNDLVQFSPSERIQDNSVNDTNPVDGNVNVTYMVTLPDDDVILKLDFFVIYFDTDEEVKYSKVYTFNITVGTGANVPIENPFTFTGVVDHFSIYLGAPAIIALAIGTILYEKDKEKYTKAHGILASISFILTTVNIIFIAIQPALWISFFSSSSWVSFFSSSKWVWAIHIILGVGGWIAGLIAAITGLSGIRLKWPGYTALACWSLNFLVGILQMGVRI